MLKFNSLRYEKQYQKLLTDVLDRGFTLQDLMPRYQYLNNPKLKTKSTRIAKMCELAYFLGMLREIRELDEVLEGHICPAKQEGA